MRITKLASRILPTTLLFSSSVLAQKAPTDFSQDRPNYPLVRDLQQTREREFFRPFSSPVKLPRENQPTLFTGPSNLRNLDNNLIFLNQEVIENNRPINYSFQSPLNEANNFSVTGGFALDNEPVEITGQIGLRARPIKEQNIELEINTSLGVHHSSELGQGINISRTGQLRNSGFQINKSDIPGTTGFAQGDIQLRTNLGNSTLRTGLSGTGNFDSRVRDTLNFNSSFTVPLSNEKKCGESLSLNLSQGLAGNSATLAYIGYRSGCGANPILPDSVIDQFGGL